MARQEFHVCLTSTTLVFLSPIWPFSSDLGLAKKKFNTLIILGPCIIAARNVVRKMKRRSVCRD